MKPDYCHEGERIVWRRPIITGNVFTMAASDIRRERTGIHACVELVMDTTLLAFDVFNVGRSEERSRLAKAAYKLFGQMIQKAYPEPNVKHELDLFCRDLWTAALVAHTPQLVAGEPDARPAEFLVSGLVVKGGGTILFALPGKGKSYVGKLMAVSVDAGLSRLWYVKQAPALLINLERSALSVQARLARVNQCLGLDARRPLPVLNARGRGLSDLLPAIKRYVSTAEIGFIVVDSLSRAGFGKLVEDQTANAAIDALNSLGVSWLVIGHTPRADEEHIFGSVLFDAGADVAVKLVSQRASGGLLGIGLEVTKCNDFEPPPLSLLALHFQDDSLIEARTAGYGEFPELAASRRRTATQEIEDYLLSLGSATAAQVADGTDVPRGTVSRILAGDRRFRQVGGDRKHGILYGVADEEAAHPLS